MVVLEFVSSADAERRARRAFWKGVLLTLFFLWLGSRVGLHIQRILF